MIFLHQISNCTEHRVKSMPANSKWFFLYVVAITVLVSLIVVSQSDAQDLGSNRAEARQVIQIGDNHMSFGDWQDALFQYDNAIAIDPTYAKAYMKKASVLAKVGRRKEAMELYNRALELNPYSEYIYDERAKLKMLAMDYTGALSDLDSAMQINPSESGIRDLKVDDLIALKDYEKALSEIDTLIAEDYRVVYELERKALVLMLMDSINESQSVIETLLLINPNSAFGHDLNGITQLKNENYALAIEHFTKAIQIDSTFAMAYYNRGLAFKYLGNNEGALVDMNKAIELRQNLAQFYFTRAIVSKNQGEMDDALADYDRALMLNDDFQAAFYNRAYTLKVLGNYTRALRDVDEVLLTDPESAAAWNLKGNAHTLQDDFREAYDSYSQAINIDPDYAEAYYNRGILSLMNNRYTSGCEDLVEADRLGFQRAELKRQAFCK